ncbi:hypothetical protein JCM10450v2_003689 [Rhodotorula kratochvilovae]
MSSADSASPTLSSSPLASLPGISQALPSPAAGDSQPGRSMRNSSYESSVDALGDAGSDVNRDEEDSFDALRAYRQGLYMYTSSRFDRFKSDLEHKNALDGHDQRQSPKTRA